MSYLTLNICFTFIFCEAKESRIISASLLAFQTFSFWQTKNDTIKYFNFTDQAFFKNMVWIEI